MRNENEINDEIKSTLEISFCGLLLESSRRYSVLADAVFSFSVEQSNFANKISGLFDAAVYSERSVHLEVL